MIELDFLKTLLIEDLVDNFPSVERVHETLIVNDNL